MLDFQNEKAISMFEKALCFLNNEDPSHKEMRLDVQIFIGNVLLNKDASGVEAVERFNLALGILVDHEAELLKSQVPSFDSNFGIGRSYTKMGMCVWTCRYLLGMCS